MKKKKGKRMSKLSLEYNMAYIQGMTCEHLGAREGEAKAEGLTELMAGKTCAIVWEK